MAFFVKRGPRFDDVVRLKLEFRFTGVRLIARPVTLIFMMGGEEGPPRPSPLISVSGAGSDALDSKPDIQIGLVWVACIFHSNSSGLKKLRVGAGIGDGDPRQMRTGERTTRWRQQNIQNAGIDR